MSSLKAVLLSTSVLISLGSATETFAQAAPSATEVVITGSRIPRPNLDQPTPIEVLTPQLIRNSGQSDLGTILAELPALSSQGTVRGNSNSFGNSGGLSYPDLRNLGTQRTLTLVDGQRHVGADPGSTAVDLSSIPPALVDRVEIITGGASAIYGSDAVSGVVNIILKKDFEGVEGDIRGGLLEPGGAGVQYNGNLSVGRNFADGRGNIVVTGIWSKDEGVKAQDLHYLHNYGTIVNPAYITDPSELYSGATPTPGDGIPDFLIVPNVISDFLGPNTVLLDANTFSPITSFNKSGQPIAVPTRTGYNSFAFGTLAAPCPSCFANEDYESLSTPIEREGGTINMHYDFTPSLRFTLDAKYIRNEVNDFVMPSFTFGDYQLTPDNAFITPQIANVLTGLDAADYPFISRDMADFGPRTNNITRETFRIVTGLEGKFDLPFAEFKWNGAVNFGTTQNHITAANDEIPGNFEAALDSVIDPVTHMAACRINVPSMQPDGYEPPAGVINAAACVPYNPFGQQNSQAALNYSRATTHEYQRISQGVIDLNSNFDTSRFLNLPGGPISIAFGGEYRKETVADKQDPLVIAGLTDVAATPNFAGGFEVVEGYVEIGLPIIKHQFLIDEFSLDGAERAAHYTSVGEVNAWKISGVYGPVPDFKFRGSYSESVRAPNLTEGFLPPSGTFFTVTDPCDSSVVNQNVNRAANCLAQGIPANFTANDNASVEGTVSGNSTLKAEVSTSYTLGGVIQPRFLPNFSMTVDYYHISIIHAITEVGAQDILNNCYDGGAGLDAIYCSLFTRDSGNNINFIKSTYINASALQTDGLEVQANYGFWADPLHFGLSTHSDLPAKVTVSGDVNYLMHLRNFPFETDPSQVHILGGTVGFPQFRFLGQVNYEQGPVTVDWAVRYVDKSARFNKDPTQADFAESISPAYVPAEVYNDLTVSYHLPTSSGRVELYVGATDIFNVEPAIDVIEGNPTGADGSGLYDFGRYVFAGARMKY